MWQRDSQDWARPPTEPAHNATFPLVHDSYQYRYWMEATWLTTAGHTLTAYSAWCAWRS